MWKGQKFFSQSIRPRSEKLNKIKIRKNIINCQRIKLTLCKVKTNRQMWIVLKCKEGTWEKSKWKSSQLKFIKVLEHLKAITAKNQNKDSIKIKKNRESWQVNIRNRRDMSVAWVLEICS